MRVSLLHVWRPETSVSEKTYRSLTIEHARHLREGKATHGDSAIDPMIRTAAERYNSRWYLFFSALRLPRVGWFDEEVAARSDVERG